MRHNCIHLLFGYLRRICSCRTLVKAGLSLPQVFIDLLAVSLDLPLILFQRCLLIKEQLLDQIVVDGRPLLIATATLDVRATLLYLGRRQ